MSLADGPELRDIHVPPPPAWWPPAPGWWLLAALLLAACIACAWWLRRRMRARRARLAILRELEHCISAAGDDAVQLAAGLSRFLRRMSLREDPHATSLAGEAWLEYLDGRGHANGFRDGIGRVLLDAPFRSSAGFDRAQLVALVRRWTRTVLDEAPRHV